MKTDQEILNAGVQTRFKTMDVIDAERFLRLIKRNNFDDPAWQRHVWAEESVASLSQKAQTHWQHKQRGWLMDIQEQIRYWIDTAEQDLRTAEHLFEKGDYA